MNTGGDVYFKLKSDKNCFNLNLLQKEINCIIYVRQIKCFD